MLDQLIAAPDMFEVVLDAIATTLANECANQQALAIFEGRDPELHAWRVFVESVSAHDQFAARDGARALKLPIVNVCYSRSELPENKGSSDGRGNSESQYLIDCYASCESIVGIEGGNVRPDEASARVAYRVARQVRNILMAVEYQDLGLAPGSIAKRWVSAIESMRPRVGQATFNEKIAVARIRFGAEFVEDAPQVTPVILERLSGVIKRDEDGQILAQITKGLPV